LALLKLDAVRAAKIPIMAITRRREIKVMPIEEQIPEG
jgi:hypothetical protein